MTEPKDSEGLDTAAIDDGWGDDPEPAPAAPVAKAKPSPKAPIPLPAPAPPAPAELPPDDEIEFEEDVVVRDSMPTFQHPNPLAFDHDPDAESKPRPAVPRAPRVPKLPRG